MRRSRSRFSLAARALLGALLGVTAVPAVSAIGSPAQDGAAEARLTPLPVSGLVAEGAARPSVQIDTPGRRAAWLGTERGDFEAWVYPLKVLRGLELEFTFRDRTFSGAELARTVEIRPEWSAITYAHEAFRVRQTLATPIDEPANLMLLDVDASFPVTVRVTFHIDLAPMWPAGLGGQYSYWDAELPGFVIGEGSGRNLAMVAAPGATEPTVQPAHSLPDHPTGFALRFQPGERTRAPLVVAAWTEGMEGPGGLDGLRERYRRLVANPVAAIAPTAAHYRRLLADTVRVATPEPRLDEAFAWAKVRLDQGMVCNPHLGCGLVAGYGRARAGYRPGFGWFFGGDALYNSWAFEALGAHDTVATALEFLARYQRDDGKIMHELSQAAGALDWFEDYPYGYYHAEGSPYFIDAVARHVRATGDLEWGRSMMPAVRAAYAYSWSAETDGDGLMENTVAGLGAVEMGALREAAVHQDLYLVSIWTRALGSLAELAAALGDGSLATEATERAAHARSSLERLYWMEEAGHNAFGTTTDGGRLEELTLWSILPAALQLSRPEIGARNVATVASPAITTDWGTRMLASSSELYDPLIYNQGTVWPFLSGFAGMAAWAHGNPWAGLDLLRGLARLSSDHSHGAVHEVLSGDRYQPMGPSVPHQLFSTSSLVTPMVGGLFGLDRDAVGGVVTLAPLLPADWRRARLDNVPYRDGRLSFALTQERDALGIRVRWSGEGPGPRLRLAPALPAGARGVVAHAGTEALEVQSGRRGSLPTATVELTPTAKLTEVAWRWSGGLPLSFESPHAEIGERSRGLRVLAAETSDDGAVTLTLAGRAGERYGIAGPDGMGAEELRGVAVPGAAAAEGGQLTSVGPGSWELVLEGPGGYRGAKLRLTPGR